MPAARVVTVLLLLACPAVAAETTVTLDGKPLPLDCLSLNGTPRTPVAGDLVLVDDIWIRLEGPGDLNLRMVKRPWGRLLVTGSPARIVAADLQTTLSRIDRERCALELSHRLAVGEEDAVPESLKGQ